MFDEIRAARPGEKETVCRFYEQVCADLEQEDYGPGWHVGVYPAREDLEAHIRSGELLLGRIGGRAAALLGAILDRAAAAGYTVMHLDVVSGNLPAERLYQKLGFRFTEEKAVWYPDTGDIRVRLYERALTNTENLPRKV